MTGVLVTVNLLLASAGFASAFSSTFGRCGSPCSYVGTTRTVDQLYMSSPENPPVESEAIPNDEDRSDATEGLSIPLTFDEMAKQASKAMNDAYESGVNRQTIRVMLPRDPSSAQIGQYFEEDAALDTQNLILVPPDETWQGGIMQLYRAASPTCKEILRRYSPTPGGVPPKMIEDRSVDESGVDGVGLWISQSSAPADDVSCFVQPTQETVGAIESISEQAGDRLVVLMNPQWRNVDDALDAASKGDGIFGNIASFLGGKGGSLKRLEEMGFQNTFTLEGYVCKGGNVRLVKRFDSDWGVFAENDSGTGFIRVGTSEARPSYQAVDKMLDDNGISLKYARDIGLAPKI